MGIETCTQTIIIGKKEELTKLYKILESMPDKNVSGRQQKAFRDNPLYNGETGPQDNGYFTMNDVVLWNASDLDSKFGDEYFLAIDSTSWNGYVNTELFLEANDINFDQLIESRGNDYEPFAIAWHVINKIAGYNESVQLIDEGILPDDPRNNVEPSKQIQEGSRIMSRYADNKPILKSNCDVELALENIE